MARELRATPIQVVEGWMMHLYCRYSVDWDHDANAGNGEFGGYSKEDSHRQAKIAGWVFHRDRTVTCPQCARALGLR